MTPSITVYLALKDSESFDCFRDDVLSNLKNDRHFRSWQYTHRPSWHVATTETLWKKVKALLNEQIPNVSLVRTGPQETTAQKVKELLSEYSHVVFINPLLTYPCSPFAQLSANLASHYHTGICPAISRATTEQLTQAPSGCIAYQKAEKLYWEVNPQLWAAKLPELHPFWVTAESLQNGLDLESKDLVDCEFNKLSNSLLLSELAINESEEPQREDGQWLKPNELSGALETQCLTLSQKTNFEVSLLAHNFYLKDSPTKIVHTSKQLHQNNLIAHTMLLRIKGHQIGSPLPAIDCKWGENNEHTLSFKASTAAKPIQANNRSAIEALIALHNLRTYRDISGLSMTSRIYKRISETLTQHHANITRITSQESACTFIYGAGKHTELMLEIWQQLDLPPPQGILVSQANGEESFHNTPVYERASVTQAVHLVILSSATYEREMARACQEHFPQSSILSIWNSQLTHFHSEETLHEITV